MRRHSSSSFVVRQVRPLRIGLLCSLFCLMAVVAHGQETNGITTIRGRVVDQQGGVMQNATVILLNSGAVRLQQTKTDESGNFSFPNVRPGSYVIEVERTGFTRTPTTLRPPKVTHLKMRRNRRAGSR